MSDTATAHGTPTPADSPSGQAGENLITRFLVVIGGVMFIGKFVGSIFGHDGGGIINGLMLLLLFGVLIDYLRPSATLDESLIFRSGKIVLRIGTLYLLFLIIPWIATGTVGLGNTLIDSVLPEKTAEAIHNWTRDKDVRTANKIQPNGTEINEFKLEYRKALGEQAGDILAADLQEANKCSGTDPLTKKSVERKCHPAEIEAKLLPILQRADEDMAALKRLQDSTKDDDQATNGSIGKRFWSWVTSPLKASARWMVAHFPEIPSIYDTEGFVKMIVGICFLAVLVLFIAYFIKLLRGRVSAPAEHH